MGESAKGSPLPLLFSSGLSKQAQADAWHRSGKCFTVGSGISPDRPPFREVRRLFDIHCRYGISPIPKEFFKKRGETAWASPRVLIFDSN